MEKAAVDQGILDRARREAERSLSALLRSVGFTDVRIEWKKTLTPGRPSSEGSLRR